MAEIALNTDTPEVLDRSYGFGANHIDNLVITAHTTAAYEYVTAPADGVLKAVTFSASVTSSVCNLGAGLSLSCGLGYLATVI